MNNKSLLAARDLGKMSPICSLPGAQSPCRWAQGGLGQNSPGSGRLPAKHRGRSTEYGPYGGWQAGRCGPAQVLCCCHSRNLFSQLW